MSHWRTPITQTDDYNKLLTGVCWEIILTSLIRTVACLNCLMKRTNKALIELSCLVCYTSCLYPVDDSVHIFCPSCITGRPAATLVSSSFSKEHSNTSYSSSSWLFWEWVFSETSRIQLMIRLSLNFSSLCSESLDNLREERWNLWLRWTVGLGGRLRMYGRGLHSASGELSTKPALQRLELAPSMTGLKSRDRDSLWDEFDGDILDVLPQEYNVSCCLAGLGVGGLLGHSCFPLVLINFEFFLPLFSIGGRDGRWMSVSLRHCRQSKCLLKGNLERFKFSMTVKSIYRSRQNWKCVDLEPWLGFHTNVL